MDNRIGEHDRIVEALRESEETMRYIIRHDPNSIAVYDCHLHYIAVSDRYLADYNVTEKDIIGKHHYEIFPDLPIKWRQVHQRCLAGAIEANEDDTYERSDGSINYNRWECRPWYRLNGEIGGIITYTEVITERKRAEKALRESEERYRYMFTHNPQPMWLYDLQTLAFLEVNDAAVNHYGYSREEFMGMTLKDIRPVEDIPILLASLESESTYQSPREGIKHLKKNGEILYAEITSQIVSFKGQPVRHVLINDITERRKAEEKLKHVTRLYAVLSQINQAIVHTKTPEELYQKICKVAVEYGQFRMAWIGLIDETEKELNPVARAGYDHGYVDQISITIGNPSPEQSPSGLAVELGKIIIYSDISTDPRMETWRENALSRGYNSLASVPFRCKGKIVGTLALYSKDSGFFTEDEQQLLQEIGDDITFALDAMATEYQNKLTLEALSSSETHYRRLFESSMDGILIMNGETGMITDINPTLITMCGYSREQLLQESIYENQFFKDLFADGSYLMEIQEKDYVRYDDVMLETLDGHKLYVEFVSNKYFVDKKKVIKCNLRNITERKLAELRLKDALVEAQRFRQTLDHVPSHIYMKDLQSRYVYANKHTLELFDCSAKELAGCDDTHFFSTSIAKKLRKIDLRVFDGEEAAEEIDVIDKSGVRHVYWEIKVPIYNSTEDKTVWGLLGISTDITERKLAEEKLRE
ncbi:MAG TPA: PAS domain S-box protein, partial [Prolixibacteraceae bacterium]|nr:PAS domain S-box protein [Prolixibacteraceae bacterium]